MNPLRRTAFAVILSVAASGLSRAQDAPPVDSGAVLATLKTLKAKQTQAVRSEKSQVLAAINAAAADNTSAERAYEQAEAAVLSQGAGTDGARIADWRKRQGDLLRNRDFQYALRLQLAYLALTWQRASGVEVRALLPALLDYAAQVSANREVLQPFEMLRRSVSDSAFTAFYQIGPYISGLQGWEMEPLNTEGMFQMTILPEFRKDKDPRIIAYWDNRIQEQAAREQAVQNGLVANKFIRITKPALLWSRAEDMAVIGLKNRAINEMVAIIKAYPDHPDYEKWNQAVEKLVGEVSARPPESAAAAVSPAD